MRTAYQSRIKEIVVAAETRLGEMQKQFTRGFITLDELNFQLLDINLQMVHAIEKFVSDDSNLYLTTVAAEHDLPVH
jgi:protein required for attachment to host cells